MSKRRRGFPSETQVRRGVRIVHGDKQLEEKLGRNDLCPCGSGRQFKKCCLKSGCFRRVEAAGLLSGNNHNAPAARGRTSRRWSQTARRLPAEQPEVGSTPTGVFWRVEGRGSRVEGIGILSLDPGPSTLDPRKEGPLMLHVQRRGRRR